MFTLLPLAGAVQGRVQVVYSLLDECVRHRRRSVHGLRPYRFLHLPWATGKSSIPVYWQTGLGWTDPVASVHAAAPLCVEAGAQTSHPELQGHWLSILAIVTCNSEGVWALPSKLVTKSNKLNAVMPVLSSISMT